MAEDSSRSISQIFRYSLANSEQSLCVDESSQQLLERAKQLSQTFG
ncbi:hypothetical protein [Aeromonas enteropelogenes]